MRSQACTPSRFHAPLNHHQFTDIVLISDMEVTRAPIVLQMLRRTTQYRPRTNATPCSYDCPAFKNCISGNRSLHPDSHLFTDDGKRAYSDSISQFCRGMHDSSWIDMKRHHLYPSRELSAKNTCSSASAARALSTNA